MRGTTLDRISHGLDLGATTITKRCVFSRRGFGKGTLKEPWSPHVSMMGIHVPCTTYTTIRARQSWLEYSWLEYSWLEYSMFWWFPRRIILFLFGVLAIQCINTRQRLRDGPAVEVIHMSDGEISKHYAKPQEYTVDEPCQPHHTRGKARWVGYSAQG